MKTEKLENGPAGYRAPVARFIVVSLRNTLLQGSQELYGIDDGIDGESDGD